MLVVDGRTELAQIQSVVGRVEIDSAVGVLDLVAVEDGLEHRVD